MTTNPLYPGIARVPAYAEGGRSIPSRSFLHRHYRSLVATSLFFLFAIYYGVGLYPGVGGEFNPGDSAKFQVLAHAQIMVHGPGYPLYLLLATFVRALELPIAGWWQIAFVLSAIPAALATTFAFLIGERVTDSVRFGLATALLFGSAHLTALQATEAEVYALNVAFVLAVMYLLVLFVETERLSFFLAACAIYAISFGNHLMMVSLLPLFVGLTVIYHHVILCSKSVIAISAFVLLGASQYLYLAHMAYDPGTAYSEYMPLPPSVNEMVHYIIGTYFSDLYGSGLTSLRTLEALGETFWSAHPWVAVPLVIAGISAFLGSGHSVRDPDWRKVAVLYGGALCFLPFMLWYGAGDIKAFHLPLLALALIAATASLGRVVRRRKPAIRWLGLLLIAIGLLRMAQTGLYLTDRDPAFAEFVPEVKAILARLPREEEPPFVALDYDLRMVAMYYVFAGDLPKGPDYRLAWRLVDELGHRSTLSGVVMPEGILGYLEDAQRRRPDLACRIVPLTDPDRFKWTAYGFRCVASSEWE